MTIFKKLQNGNDVRGAAIATQTEERTLSPQAAAWIARAFGLFLADKTGKDLPTLRIGIGHDSRLTAADLKEGACRGLCASQCFDCGLITTPAMFQSVLLPESRFDGAIMLTASHLPYNRNGMKFFTADGALSHAQLDTILEIAEKEEKANREKASAGEADKEPDLDSLSYPPLPEGDACPPVLPFDMRAVYSTHMRTLIKEGVNAADYDHPLKGLHLVVDAGNGSAGFFAFDILESLGADISGSRFLEPDGTFPNHVPNPENAVAMQAIREAVLESHADLGIIFDCDGDRGAVVFADGTEVNRNTLIALLAAIVAESAPGSTIVTDSVTSDELASFLTGTLGLKHLRFKRGYKNVIDKGVALNASGERCELAIETSGHGAFKENHFSDDGAYIAVKIIIRLARLKAEGKKIEDLISGLSYPAQSQEKRFAITRENFADYGKTVLADFEAFCRQDERFALVTPNYEGVRVSYDIDGKQGWVLLRMSLHDPVMPFNLEARQEGGCEAVMAALKPFFDSCDGLK